MFIQFLNTEFKATKSAGDLTDTKPLLTYDRFRTPVITVPQDGLSTLGIDPISGGEDS